MELDQRARTVTHIRSVVERNVVTEIVVCCDGLDPEYLNAVETPGWDTIADEGRSGTCPCVVPSLTNVNNVSIVTGAYPETHGITGNTYYDSEKDERVYMNDPSFLRRETLLRKSTAQGERVGAVFAKKKLQRMVGGGCAVTANAENPPEWLEDAVGPAPDIYSGEASAWLMEASEAVLDENELDRLYVSTTDVVPHKHAPGEERAAEWVRELDDGIARLHERASDIVVTADHGMSRKTLCVDIEAHLARTDIDATVIRLIRDEHTYHHRNLGGAAYVYLEGDSNEAKNRLTGVEGVELVLTSTEAAERFRLALNRVGDLMVLGTEEAVFGPVDAEDKCHAEVDLRSHGSHHEQEVPYATTVNEKLSSNIRAFTVLK